MAYDADGSWEASLVDNGIYAIHNNVDCIDGALQIGSQVDVRKKPCWYDDLWLCFGNLCLVGSKTLE